MTALTLTMTTAGLGRFTAAQASDDIDLTIASVALTDAEFVVAPTLTALPGEFRRIETIAGSAIGDNIVHMIVRDDADIGYDVRGFGLFLADGTLFAVYGQADRIVGKSPASSLLLALDIAFPTSDIAQLTFGDTNFLNPPATSTTKGVVELATVAEGLAGDDPSRVPPVAVVDAMIAATVAAAVTARVPAGVILLWSGVAEAVPAGWAVCDGRTVDLADGSGRVVTPDLRGRVPVGVSAAHALGSTFGAESVSTSVVGDHQHPASVVVDAAATGASIATTTRDVDAGSTANGVVTSATLNDPTHAHTATAAVDPAGSHDHLVDVVQPSIALHFIIKV